MATATEKETRTFEKSLGELEQIVRRLEGGELTLDDSLQAFEKGVGIARECEKHLEEAKGKIEQLTRMESGETKAVPFAPKD